MRDIEGTLDPRKALHVKLLRNTHADFKLSSIKLQLTMQSILEELVTLVIQEDPYIIKKLKVLGQRIRDREVEALSNTDADSLLDHLEDIRRRSEK